MKLEIRFQNGTQKSLSLPEMEQTVMGPVLKNLFHWQHQRLAIRSQIAGSPGPRRLCAGQSRAFRQTFIAKR
jgi:hypothetical protein